MPLLLTNVDWRPGARQLRTFGVIFALACVALGVLTAWRGSIAGISVAPGAARAIARVLWGVAAASAGLAAAAPRALRPLYVALTAITLPIGLAVSYAAMAALFFLVMTPIGLVFRLLGRDALKRRLDTSAGSYWVRRPDVDDIDRYYHQY